MSHLNINNITANNDADYVSKHILIGLDAYKNFLEDILYDDLFIEDETKTFNNIDMKEIISTIEKNNVRIETSYKLYTKLENDIESNLNKAEIELMSGSLDMIINMVKDELDSDILSGMATTMTLTEFKNLAHLTDSKRRLLTYLEVIEKDIEAAILI